jgi:hypothetical protein
VPGGVLGKERRRVEHQVTKEHVLVTIRITGDEIARQRVAADVFVHDRLHLVRRRQGW